MGLDIVSTADPARLPSRARRVTLLRRFAQGGRGQSLVEFAVLLPFLLVIVLGTIDLLPGGNVPRMQRQ